MSSWAGSQRTWSGRKPRSSTTGAPCKSLRVTLAALEALAVLYFEQQRYEEAMVRFRAVVEIDPDNAPAYSNIGATLHHLDRSEEALASFERALALDPTLESARTGRSGAQARLHRDPEYEEALERGRTRLEEGRLEEALAATRTALGQAPRFRGGERQPERGTDCHGPSRRCGGFTAPRQPVQSRQPGHPAESGRIAPSAGAVRGSGGGLYRNHRVEPGPPADPRRAGRHPVPAATLRRSGRGSGTGAGAGAPMRPSSHRCMCLRARAELAAGRPGAALEAFDRALAIDPALAGATAGRERALQAMEQRGR